MNLQTKIFGRYEISPTLLPTDLGRRYFHNTDGQYSVGIFQAGNFLFWHARSVGKSFFCISDRYSDGMWNHRQKVFRREYSVGNIVGKYFTDERSITHRRNMSVGKTVKSGSENQYIGWKPVTRSFRSFSGITTPRIEYYYY